MPNRDVRPNMLRAARAFLSMSQDELAAGAGLSSRTVVTVEKGGASAISHMAVVGYLLTRGISFRQVDDGRVIGVFHDVR